MPIKQYNPTTPARRGMTSQDLSDVTTRKPLKSLVKAGKQKAGRNNTGKITVRHRGGGVKLGSWLDTDGRGDRVRSEPQCPDCPRQGSARPLPLHLG